VKKFLRIDCADACGEFFEVPEPSGPIGRAAVALVWSADLIVNRGWSREGGGWRCKGCTKRRRLVKALPPS
jgi:hypothetical protein